MDKEKKYSEALEWIHGLGRFGIRPGLERITELMRLLGNPHHGLRFVHVGGTNGKGSTAAMIASILRTAGYTIGLYTSPYLLSFTNRMAVNGSDIDSSELVDLVGAIRPLVDKINADQNLGPLTEFEVVTAIALTHFARKNVDLVVLEVGLGGRLDATNIVDPLLSIITNVSLEHTDILGDTVEAIAAEKAGIIKRGKPLLTAAEDRKVLFVLEDLCLKLEAPLYRVYIPGGKKGEMVPEKPGAALHSITAEGQYFIYRGFSLQMDNVFIPLRGLYQVANAATALAAIELLEGEGFHVDETQLRRGLVETSWPGRLEVLLEKPLLILDGAHNPAAVEQLAAAMPDYFSYDHLILVLGMLADKDMEAMLKYILPLAEAIIFTRPVLPRAADPEEVAAFAAGHFELRQEYLVLQNHREALEAAFNLAGPDDAILVTGSLYTVSDIRACWRKMELEAGP